MATRTVSASSPRFSRTVRAPMGKDALTALKAVREMVRTFATVKLCTDSICGISVKNATCEFTQWLNPYVCSMALPLISQSRVYDAGHLNMQRCQAEMID